MVYREGVCASPAATEHHIHSTRGPDVDRDSNPRPSGGRRSKPGPHRQTLHSIYQREAIGGATHTPHATLHQSNKAPQNSIIQPRLRLQSESRVPVRVQSSLSPRLDFTRRLGPSPRRSTASGTESLRRILDLNSGFGARYLRFRPGLDLVQS